MTITKVVDTDFTADSEGDVIHYIITVTNSGNVELEDVILVDDNAYIDGASCRLLAGEGHDGFMAVGAEVVCLATHTVTAADMANEGVDNTATASDEESDLEGSSNAYHKIGRAHV